MAKMIGFFAILLIISPDTSFAGGDADEGVRPVQRPRAIVLFAVSRANFAL